MKTKATKEPLIRIAKRTSLSKGYAYGVRAASVAIALLACGIVLLLITSGKISFGEIYGEMIQGAFGTARRVKITVRDTCALLCLAVALAPAFKMRFWNIGAEGQALVGALASCVVVKLMPDTPAVLLILLMFVASVVAGAIWGVIPGYFKAKIKANETLFTLMMNYVAIQLVAFFLKYFVKSGSGILAPMPEYGLPVIGEYSYLLNIIIVAVLTVLVYIYLKKTKHGYEISVVGESENTAKYIGINVKKVIIRTLIVSGALCGIAGLILVGGTNHTISTTTAGGRGFTAIMVSWLAKFNPIYMILTSFLIVFLEKGAGQVSTDFRLPLAISDIVTGIILFFIIGCEFFLNYKILVSKNGKEND